MSIFSAADVASFRSDRLVSLLLTYAPNLAPSDTYLLGKIQAAEAEVARKLRVFLEPTYVFPNPPTDDDIAGLPFVSPNDEPGVAANSVPIPWVEDPGNDYDPDFFHGERWGYIILRRTPAISVTSITFVYPAPTMAFYTIPKDWIRLDKRAGHIRLIPASAAFTAPLNAFLMAAMGGGQVIPNMIQVTYTAGLQGVRTDPRWADLVDVVFKTAALKVVEDLYIPASGSISADGLSQSVSFKAQDYADRIQETLFGPKGSNGGLWTSIHGLVLGVMGTTA